MSRNRSEAAKSAWARRKTEQAKSQLEKLGRQPVDEGQQARWEENLRAANAKPAPVNDEELSSLLDDLGF